MATCNDIVRLAMSRLRLLRAGEQPSDAEASDGMIALQSLYDTWVADGLLGRLNDTIISADYTAAEQDRVVNDGGYTVTLPMSITPVIPTGSYYPIWPDERIYTALSTTVPRPPRDLSLIEVVSATAVQRTVYDARKRAWVRIDSLVLTDAAPLSDRGQAGLSACLAEMIGDDYGAQPSPATASVATQFRWGLSARYDSQRKYAMADYF